jgi:rhamnose transport system ATP-binding protein
VIGIAGLIGAGRTELARAIVGLDRRDAGEVVIDGSPVVIRSPAEAAAAGIAYLPEDRRTDGLFLSMTIAANVVASDLRGSARRGIWSRRLVLRRARSSMKALAIKASSPAQVVSQLSGGNQQKVSLAMRLNRTPRILIADEPTRGVDIGAKAEIHNLLRTLSAAGTIIIVISSELPEILTVSDRILVMHAGEVTGDFPSERATEEHIMACATGFTRVANTFGGQRPERIA